MPTLPTIFVSHGSPMLALQNSPARHFLQGLGANLPRPKAIIVVSAHWEITGGSAVSLASQPETIHDFAGFPQALYDINYPAPNLFEFHGQPVDALAPLWVTEFASWMREKLESGDSEALLDYRNSAPSARQNHPSEEHLLPLFVAMGAAGTEAQARLLHSSFEHGVLAMDAYAFN